MAGIIGGFHLLHTSSSRMKKTLDFLKRVSPDFIYPGHCSGDEIVEKLKDALPFCQIEHLYAGKTIHLKEWLVHHQNPPIEPAGFGEVYKTAEMKLCT